MLAIESTNAKHSSTALVLIIGGSENAWSRLGDARRTVDTNCLPAGYQTHEFLLRTYKEFLEWPHWLADGSSCVHAVGSWRRSDMCCGVWGRRLGLADGDDLHQPPQLPASRCTSE